MSHVPDRDQLLAAVGSAGWLLEQRAVRVLDAANCHPRAGWAYADPDEPGISRELDVWSFKRLFNDPDIHVSVRASFLVECKQSNQPFAAIGQDLPPYRFSGNPTQHVLPVAYLPVAGAAGTTRSSSAWDALGFRSLARSFGESTFRATALTKLLHANGPEWKATNEGIFSSLTYPLAKSLRASQVGIPTRPFPSTVSRTRTDSLEFALHFPVILIGSPLFVIDASTEEPRVDQPPWVTAVRNLKSKTIQGAFEFDVVTEPAFEAYVNHKLAFAKALAGLVAEDPLRCAGETWVVD